MLVRRAGPVFGSYTILYSTVLVAPKDLTHGSKLRRHRCDWSKQCVSVLSQVFRLRCGAPESRGAPKTCDVQIHRHLQVGGYIRSGKARHVNDLDIPAFGESWLASKTAI